MLFVYFLPLPSSFENVADTFFALVAREMTPNYSSPQALRTSLHSASSTAKRQGSSLISIHFNAQTNHNPSFYIGIFNISSPHLWCQIAACKRRASGLKPVERSTRGKLIPSFLYPPYSPPTHTDPPFNEPSCLQHPTTIY